MYQGYWQTTLGYELKGKTLGVIGLGKIGSQVSKVALAFGMNVIAWSENLKLSVAKDNQVLAVTKEELLEKSDFITIHTVLSDRTKNLITKKDLKLMKETAFLINTYALYYCLLFVNNFEFFFCRHVIWDLLSKS